MALARSPGSSSLNGTSTFCPPGTSLSSPAGIPYMEGSLSTGRSNACYTLNSNDNTDAFHGCCASGSVAYEGAPPYPQCWVWCNATSTATTEQEVRMEMDRFQACVRTKSAERGRSSDGTGCFPKKGPWTPSAAAGYGVSLSGVGLAMVAVFAVLFL
jgi:hypothetical protein